jgi:hypothetical protein
VIIPRTNCDGAVTVDTNRVIAIAGYDGALAVDVHTLVGTTGDAIKRAHASSPLKWPPNISGLAASDSC